MNLGNALGLKGSYTGEWLDLTHMCFISMYYITSHNPHHFLLLVLILVHLSVFTFLDHETQRFVIHVSGYVVLPALGF